MNTTILFLIAGIPIALFIICFMQSLKVNRFRKQLTDGDAVVVFKGEDRLDAVVVIRMGEEVWVQTIITGEYLKRKITEVYC
jgi:hypothetical protein